MFCVAVGIFSMKMIKMLQNQEFDNNVAHKFILVIKMHTRCTSSTTYMMMFMDDMTEWTVGIGRARAGRVTI